MSGNTTSRDAATWFAVLRAATESGDRELQSLARRELEGLGYRVAIAKRPRPGQDSGKEARP